MDDHLLPLAGDWLLWRDFAVRSAGFPAAGLEVFGAGDEGARLAEVASRPDFQTAVIWQNRTAYRSAVASLAVGAEMGGSRRRQREGVVASYWQRYCSKNDTVGFFGGLAWGDVRDDGPAAVLRSRALLRDCEVHFETWCLETLMRALGRDVLVPSNRRPEHELREQLMATGDAAALATLDQLEAARRDVAEAVDPQSLLVALDTFDALFQELTGRPAVRGDDSAEGGRTPLYLDCMRDLDLAVGPGVVAELAIGMPVLLEASRWWCGRAYAHARQVVSEVVRDGPLGPQIGEAFQALWQLPKLVVQDLPELQSRCLALLDAGIENVAQRAAATFADHGPAWSLAVFQSADVQMAAPSLDAINRGEFLLVVGDFHAANPLSQSLFSARHPDPDRFRRQWHADLGSPVVAPVLVRHPATRPTSRNIADATDAGDFHLRGAGIVTAHIGHGARHVDDLVIDGDRLLDRPGTLDAPLLDLFFIPIFLSVLRTFRPFPVTGPRLTVGRTVLRRATWEVPAREVPSDPVQIPSWAGQLGMPRRVYCLATGEAKPVYLDLESPVLNRYVQRLVAQAAGNDPAARARFSEALPAPDQCWLEHAGERYACELRLVAVDSTRRGGGTIRFRP